MRILPGVRPRKQSVVGDLGKVLWVLMGSIEVVLPIASANVANLLLVRADRRRQAQIGGERLMESGVLRGAAGLSLGYAALRYEFALGRSFETVQPEIRSAE